MIDRGVVSPLHDDWYAVSHPSRKGTSVPVHYIKLWDENNLSSDEIQMLTFQMCHLYGRALRSISKPTPIAM